MQIAQQELLISFSYHLSIFLKKTWPWCSWCSKLASDVLHMVSPRSCFNLGWQLYPYHIIGSLLESSKLHKSLKTACWRWFGLLNINLNLRLFFLKCVSDILHCATMDLWWNGIISTGLLWFPKLAKYC